MIEPLRTGRIVSKIKVSESWREAVHGVVEIAVFVKFEVEERRR